MTQERISLSAGHLPERSVDRVHSLQALGTVLPDTSPTIDPDMRTVWSRSAEGRTDGKARSSVLQCTLDLSCPGRTFTNRGR